MAASGGFPQAFRAELADFLRCRERVRDIAGKRPGFLSGTAHVVESGLHAGLSQRQQIEPQALQHQARAVEL